VKCSRRRERHHQRWLLQIPPQRHRIHCVRTEVKLRESEDRCLTVFHGPLRLRRYDADGRLAAASGPARWAA